MQTFSGHGCTVKIQTAKIRLFLSNLRNYGMSLFQMILVFLKKMFFVACIARIIETN